MSVTDIDAERRILQRTLDALQGLFDGGMSSVANGSLEPAAASTRGSGVVDGFVVERDARSGRHRMGSCRTDSELPSRRMWSLTNGRYTARAEFKDGFASWAVVAVDGSTTQVPASGIAETMGEAKRAAEMALRQHCSHRESVVEVPSRARIRG